MARAIKYSFIILIFFGASRTFACPIDSQKDSLIHKIMTTAHPGKNEDVAVLFVITSDCSKCILATDDLISKYEKRYHRHVRHIAMVQCYRESELQVFRTMFDWHEPMLHDEGAARSILELPPDTRLALFDRQGHLVDVISADNELKPGCSISRKKS